MIGRVTFLAIRGKKRQVSLPKAATFSFHLHTPLPALTPADELQTPVPTPFALVTQPLALPQPSMETNRGADSPEESPADRLQDDRRENKHFFWPVDPVEWSPITKVQVHSVPATANDYLLLSPKGTSPGSIATKVINWL